MAIDTTLFGVDIPAGTYAVGDVVQLVNIDGPANVRSGRGSAILKTICTAQFGSNAPFWKVHVKNSDWVDDVQSFAGSITGQPAVFDDESGSIQKGHNCNLTPNSGWQVWAECVYPGTSTAANSVFALIDIDYPQVGGVTDPKAAQGFPTSITYTKAGVTSIAFGNLVSSQWVSESVDYLKAGYEYVLDAVELSSSPGVMGFIAFSNAAGMGGLTRIIPVFSNTAGIKYSIKYSSVLVKGPFDIKLKMFQSTSASVDVLTVHDYVKKKA